MLSIPGTNFRKLLRNNLLSVLCIFLLASAAPLHGQTASIADRTTQLNALFGEYWQDQLKDSPEFASSIGDKRYNDILTNSSVEAINHSLQRDMDLLQRFAAIADDGLPQQLAVSHQLAMRELLQEQEGARFKEWEMPISQESGFQTGLPQLWQQMTFETAKDYEDYIARLNAMPAYIQQNVDNMQRGADEGRIPPKFLLLLALQQVKDIIAQKPEDSPFAMPVKSFPKSIPEKTQDHLRTETLEAIRTQVLPAYMRLARFMEVSYVPKGRKDPGIWAIPDGDAYYAFCVKRETTTDRTPAQIHALGKAEVARDDKEILALAHSLGFADRKALAAAILVNPKLHPVSADALIADYSGYLEQMKARLPELFGNLPKEKFAVEAMPDFVAKTGPAAYYEQGSPDGKRPGKVRVNTYDYAHRVTTQVEAIAYHEGIPGHHLQISLAQEQTGVPEFRKYLGYTAYVEGWALYSESLGKEIGFYKDPYSDYGRLDNDMWRSVRLVVDTGVHSQHWTRDQMVQYFHDHTAMDDTNINSEVDRYIAWPGQALAYKSGQLKILELREYAKQKLGAKFSLKAFHDELLGVGALPLDYLDTRMRSWVDAQVTK
jgi:uncharacterized protein (DUF885 family)